MHVLFVADTDSKYGASCSMKQLIKGMIEYCNEIEISVVLPRRIDRKNELEDFYRQLGCNVYKIYYEPFYQNVPDQKWRLPIKYLIRGMEYLFGRWTGVFCLSKKVNMNIIDIIHSNSSREDFSAALALKYHKPLIWHIREFGDKDYKCFSFRKNYIGLMNKSAAEFIAVSDAVKEHWIKKGIDGGKIFRIYDGVHISERDNNERGKKDNIKLLMLGSICETKGQDQIIRALGLLNKEERQRFTLDFVGNGTKSYIKKIQKIVEIAGVSQIVNFLGYQKDFQKNIRKYDCGVMCSKSEAFGRVTIEYMMAGLPVIASDTGANRELVCEGENGLLYQYNDILDLKNKIVYISNNSFLVERMRKAAQDYAYSYFSIKKYVELIYTEYLNIIENFKGKKNYQEIQ